MFKQQVSQFILRLLGGLAVSVMLLAGTAIDSISHAYPIIGPIPTGGNVYLVRESADDPDGPWYDVYDSNMNIVNNTHYNDMLAQLPIVQKETISTYGLQCGHFCFTEQGWVVGTSPDWAVEVGAGPMLQTTLNRIDELISLAQLNKDTKRVNALKKERQALVKLMADFDY